MQIPFALVLLGLVALIVALVAWSRVRAPGTARANRTPQSADAGGDAALLTLMSSPSNIGCDDGGSSSDGGGGADAGGGDGGGGGCD